jgi:hypothetical protein
MNEMQHDEVVCRFLFEIIPLRVYNQMHHFHKRMALRNLDGLKLVLFTKRKPHLK